MIRELFVAGAILALSTGQARAAEYTIDPAHAQAAFSVTHLAVSKVHGQIPMTAGSLTIGADDLPVGGRASFDLKALASGDDKRDADLRSANFFDVDHYPTMTFVVRKVDGTAQNFTLTGDLTIHGVTRPVTLKAAEVGTAVVRGHRHVGYTATTTLDRRDFGMTWGNVMGGSLIAGFDVGISVDIDAIALAGNS